MRYFGTIDMTTEKNKRCVFVAVFGVCINLCLFLVKLYIGLSCNSLSIYLDSLNNALDSLVCIGVAVGFVLMQKIPSKKYPFGFGRIESLVNFLISIIIFITGISFAYVSLERLMYPESIFFSVKYAFVIAFTAAVKLFMLFFYKKQFSKTGSVVIKSLSLDSILDFFVTLCTLLSFTLSEKVGYSVDGVTGIVISAILIAEGVKSVIASSAELLGKRNSEICDKAEKIISSDADIISVKSVNCHIYGGKAVVNADVIAKGDLSLLSQRLNENLSRKLGAELYLLFGGHYEQ